MKKIYYCYFLAMSFMLLSTMVQAQTCPAGNTLFVNASVSGGTGTGSSWPNAFTSLQDALTLANTCPGVTQIWVAKGTYKPTTGTDRTISFVMKNNLALYGGFAGTEATLAERNLVTNPTILSGDIGAAGNADNSYHVIFNDNNALNITAILDGFIITGGNADGTLVNETRGGGMLNNFSSPSIANCTFSGNSAGAGGGGGMMNNSLSSPMVTNCSFSGNSAVNGGGGMYNANSYATIINCSFSGNSTGPGEGGGMMTFFGSPIVTNCIIWGNTGEIYHYGSGITTVSYSIVKGGYTGTGNLDLDPLFVSQPTIALGTTGDLRLQAGSPAIDAGSDAANTTLTDLLGLTRKVDAICGGSLIDMGAYENQQAATVTPTTWYTDADGDSYGTGTGQPFCSNPGAGWANRAGDCNDGDAAINPGATEICNGIDDNCNGTVDEGVCSVPNTWYRDKDQDKFGNPASSIVSITQPKGYVGNNLDCKDWDNTIYPNAPELEDGKDNDCDGVVDDGLACRRPWYLDGDGDDYGRSTNTNTIRWSCVRPNINYVEIGGDCNDNDATLNPGAPELCDGKDNNCNGIIDEGLTPVVTWYRDADNDGYGRTNSTIKSCGQPVGYVATSGDCNDANAAINPGAKEICGNGIDDNCNGLLDGCATPGIEYTDGEKIVKPLAKIEEETKALEVRLTPNPARTELVVVLDQIVPNQKVEMVLMTSEGKSLKTEILVPSVKGQRVRFEVSRFASGYYLLQVRQGVLTQTKKVMIIR